MSAVPTDIKRLAFRVPEAAEALGLCRATIYNLIARGELRAVKIGSATRIPADEVNRLAGMGGDAA